MPINTINPVTENGNCNRKRHLLIKKLPTIYILIKRRLSYF